MVDLGRDIGFPAWVFGDTCFAFLAGERVAFVYVEDGLDHLAVRLPDGTVVPLDVPFTVIGGLTATGSTLVSIAASPTMEAHVVAIAVDGWTAADALTLVPPRQLPFGDDWFSTPSRWTRPPAAKRPTPCCTARETPTLLPPTITVRRCSS